MPVYKVTAVIEDVFYYESDTEAEAIEYCRKHGQHWLSQVDETFSIMERADMNAELVNEGDVDPDLICSVNE